MLYSRIATDRALNYKAIGKEEKFMTMDFKFDEYGSLEHITFRGLNGCETVRDLKNALELLKIENPLRSFQDRVRAGEFDNTPDDEYEQITSTMKFVSSLWRYPDVPEGESTQSEMNVLMLLANAVEAASKLNATISRQGLQ